MQPNEIFERTKASLVEAIFNLKISQDLSTPKIEEFRNKSKEIISSGFNQLKPLFNKNRIEENFGVQQKTGSYNLFDRLAFCEDTDVSFMEVESILGTS